MTSEQCYTTIYCTSIKNLTASVLPYSAASCSGVPLAPLVLTLYPCPTSNLHTTHVKYVYN